MASIINSIEGRTGSSSSSSRSTSSSSTSRSTTAAAQPQSVRAIEGPVSAATIANTGSGSSSGTTVSAGIGKAPNGGVTQFNPGLHVANRFGGFSGNVITDPAKVAANNIGTITQAYLQPYTKTDVRWGFRFPYQPNAISQNVSTSVDQNPGQAEAFINFFPGQQSIDFELLLNRIPDINSPDHENYIGGRGVTSAAELQANGTLVDLQFLYRTINGGPYGPGDLPGTTQPDVYGVTSDIGYLMMNLVDIRFGPSFRFRGFITGVTVNHQQFGARMQPTLTTLRISANRMSTFSMPSDSPGTLNQFQNTTEYGRFQQGGAAAIQSVPGGRGGR